MTIANRKGGTGKTTTACNLGNALAGEGKRILIIDFDPQANLSMNFGIERPDELAMWWKKSKPRMAISSRQRL